MPIHQTKLMMAKPQADRDVDAPDADAVDQQIRDGVEQQHQHEQNATQSRTTTSAGVPRQDDRR